MSGQLLRKISAECKYNMSQLNLDSILYWYPSAGFDVVLCKILDGEDGLYIFTDTCYSGLDISQFTKEVISNINRSEEVVHLKGRSSITCEKIEQMGYLNRGSEINFDQRQVQNQVRRSPVFYGEFSVQNKEKKSGKIKIIFIGCQNEAFCHDYLIAQNAEIKYIINKTGQTYYGGAAGPSGIWRVNILRQLHCKYFVTTIREGENIWNEGDDAVVECYRDFGPKVTRPPFYCREAGALIVEVNGITTSLQTRYIRQVYSDNNHREDTNSKFIGINEVPYD